MWHPTMAGIITTHYRYKRPPRLKQAACRIVAWLMSELASTCALVVYGRSS
jgi:hypothetical protein